MGVFLRKLNRIKEKTPDIKCAP